MLFSCREFLSSVLALVIVLLSEGWMVATAAAVEPSMTANEIRIEATRPNDSPEGRPLPLASHWTGGEHPLAQGWGPAWQLRMIEQGHHLLPWFSHPVKGRPDFFVKDAEYYEVPLARARKEKLPFVIINTQWECLLSAEPYLSLPPEKNPNIVTTDGRILPKVCPFGPVELWREVGKKWTATSQMKRLQELYPDPPLVIFLSNNEHGKLQWNEAETSKRYVEKYGKGKTPDFMRKVVADGWIERYRGLQEGLRAGLVSPSWQQRAIFVGYEAVGPCHFGRWGQWDTCSLCTAGRIAPDPLMWDGGSPSYYSAPYTALTDYTIHSTQVEFMNLVFMQREAYRLNPKFWLEFSVWDGNVYEEKSPPNQPWKYEVYEYLGQTYSPMRHGGWVQFGMWLLRPRVVRDYRGWLCQAEYNQCYFMAIVDAVDRVHTNRTLREFWRKGELVPNRAHKHPYQAAIPKEYQDVDRWFLLDADVNPKQYVWQSAEHPAGSQEIPVFSLALVRGESPARRWLVYAHSPLKDRKNVRITIPDYREVTVDVSVAGSFYLVDEKDKTVKAVKQ